MGSRRRSTHTKQRTIRGKGEGVVALISDIPSSFLPLLLCFVLFVRILPSILNIHAYVGGILHCMNLINSRYVDCKSFHRRRREGCYRLCTPNEYHGSQLQLGKSRRHCQGPQDKAASRYSVGRQWNRGSWYATIIIVQSTSLTSTRRDAGLDGTEVCIELGRINLPQSLT